MLVSESRVAGEAARNEQKGLRKSSNGAFVRGG
jgi:hypothetical protein